MFLGKYLRKVKEQLNSSPKPLVTYFYRLRSFLRVHVGALNGLVQQFRFILCRIAAYKETENAQRKRVDELTLAVLVDVLGTSNHHD